MSAPGAQGEGPAGPGRRVLLWFRRDLRLADNPALVAALSLQSEVVPVYLWAPEEDGQFQPGRCSRWWLAHSLAALDADLRALGSRLLCFRTSDSGATLVSLARQLGAGAVLFNHLFDPISMVRDNEVKATLGAAGLFCQSFNADVLREPWEVLDKGGKPFTCFDAFWTAHCGLPYPPTPPLPLPAALPPVAPHVDAAAAAAGAVPLDKLGIMSADEEMSNAQLGHHWAPGSQGAHRVLDAFVRSSRLRCFDADRAKTDRASTSRLSPHIHYGEISVRHIYYVAKHQELEWARAGEGGTSVADFLRQLGYREYSRYLSFHFPFTHERSLLEHLRAVPWKYDQRLFKAWRQGRTGYPLVDAAMREVWVTGWMHNRMRVVAASFMVKNLLLPWQWGLKHYWDALLDADLECDALGWQYVSGCMADAHEFSYTIDHSVEAKRFDPQGHYVRRWLPVLARLPAQYIHEPWSAPESVLADAGVELGVNYPFPVISVEDSLVALSAANAVVQQCMRGGAGASAAAASAGGEAPQGPFRPSTHADPAEAERLFAEHYRNTMMVSDPPPAREGSPASEDVQSNLVLRGDGASAEDVTSAAALPADAARSCWAGPAVPAASGVAGAGSSGAGSAAPPLPEQLPEGRQQQGSTAPVALPARLAWQAPLTVPPHGSGGSGGLGGSGHATMTGLSLGVVPSLSGGAAAAVPQAAPRPRVRRQPDSGSGEQQQQQQGHAAPQPQATNEAQQAVSLRGGGAAETVQQPCRGGSTASAPEVGTAAAPPPAAPPPEPDALAGHKRARARSPPPS